MAKEGKWSIKSLLTELTSRAKHRFNQRGSPSDPASDHDDASQNILLRIWLQTQKKGEQHLNNISPGYLEAALRNERITFFRQRNQVEKRKDTNSAIPLASTEDLEIPGLDDTARTAEIRIAWDKAWKDLQTQKPNWAKAWELDQKGNTLTAIAQALETQPETVRSWVYRARCHLRAHLKKSLQ